MIAPHTSDAIEAETGVPAWEVALLFPAQGAWAEDDYLHLDTNRLVEFSDGNIEVLPMPGDKDQSIVLSLATIMIAFAQRIGGKVLVAPLRLRLWPEKVREPDLFFLASANDPRRQNAYCAGADLVVEVVSPDDPARDLVTRRSEYAQAGIPEYWIVDPQAEAITVLRIEAASYVEHGVYGRGEIATSAHYAGLQAPVNDVLDLHEPVDSPEPVDFRRGFLADFTQLHPTQHQTFRHHTSGQK